MRKIRFIISFFLVFMSGQGFSNGYQEVLFSHSVMSGNYGYSLVSYSGMSWVENVKGRIPLSDSVWFTPNNALSLQYTSSSQGHWEVTVFYPEKRTHRLRPEDETLSFRVFIQEGTAKAALPKMALLQGDTCTQQLSLLPYLDDQWDINKWLHVQIPISDLRDLKREEEISGITFYQAGATVSGVVNHLFIDQIEFIRQNPPQTELAFPAVLDRASGSDKHVLVEWQLPLDPGIRFVKIYRSEDGQEFQAVALRPISGTGYVDMVPVTDKSYHYKVSWVDHHYQESPFSNTLKVEVKPLSDDALLDAVQAAHIHFFVQRTEFNSGMHSVRFIDREAVVSVEETGYSLLAYTVGVSKDQITGRAYIRRLNSLVDFLCDQAEQHKGMYPAYLDGRTGRGVYHSAQETEVSLRATAALMQGLLVSRNYLKNFLATRQESRQDRAFRARIESTVDRIDQLWVGVQWSEFALEDGAVLYDHWSPVTGFQNARPLGGFGPDLLTYILALSSPDFAIADEAYLLGLGVNRAIKPLNEPDILQVDEFLEGDDQLDETVSGQGADQNLSELVLENSVPDSLSLKYKVIETHYTSDTVMYGFHLDVGRIDQSLLEAYTPFMAFDPRFKKDIYANYEKSMIHLIQAYKRRDNELDAGNMTSDIWGTYQDSTSQNRLPVIVPSISIASYAFTPEVAKRATRALYREYGHALFTEYGFRNWISVHDHQISDHFSGLNQAAIPVMIENGRNALIWNLFMQHEDIDRTVDKFFHEDL